MLLADRLLGVDGDEVEDQRQRFVLADHAGDEPLITFGGVRHLGHVLSGQRSGW